MNQKIIRFLTYFALINLFALAALTPALADVEDDILDQLRPIEDVYSPDEPVTGVTLARTVARIIQAILGFLGVIFIVLIVYSGFVWMTSAGNSEKIDKAKQTLVAAAIGAAIVLAAYAITFFVIDQLLQATGVASSGLD